MKKIVCGITGYRQEKLPFGFDESHERCDELKKKLFCKILEMSRVGELTLVTGMCRGVDCWAAKEALKIRETMPGRIIKIWAIIPYERQAAAWPKADRELYQEILSKADIVEYVSKEYTRACIHQRNRKLIDVATHLLAVYDGQPGGTHNTINYARKKGLEITIIKP